MSALWSNRPFWLGGSVDPIPKSGADLNAAIWWYLGGVGTVLFWTSTTGMGVSPNTALGQIFWRPPVEISYGSHIYQRGSAPTFTGGLWAHRAAIIYGSSVAVAVVAATSLALIGEGQYVSSVVASESKTNVEKAVELGTATNVPY